MRVHTRVGVCGLAHVGFLLTGTQRKKRKKLNIYRPPRERHPSHKDDLQRGVLGELRPGSLPLARQS